MTTTVPDQQPTTDRSVTPDMIDQLIQESGVFSAPPDYASERARKLTNNLLETWESYWLQISLPGADLGPLKVQVAARQVTVRGKYRIPTIEAATCLRQEMATGQFCDMFTIPGEVDGDKAEARYDRGILTIRLPKVAHLKPASITVQVVI